MKIICISDTHEKESLVNLPEGDILIHAGDMTMRGDIPALSKVANWFGKQKNKFNNIITIPSNHDFCFENNNRNIAINLLKENGVTFLDDSGITINGFNIWGSGWTPYFYNWSYNLHRGSEIAKVWAKIPIDTNILITHGPPANIGSLDLCDNGHVGCEDLYNRIQQLHNLKLFCSGHIHSGYGTIKINNTTFVNASTCNEKYQPINSPIIIDL
jgi:Icc-related predicted phosphoesterase